MPWTIYCHTLIADGRKYVGQTRLSMGVRWKGHCASARKSKGQRIYFANAIRTYGREAFSHEVLEVCETQTAADEAERSWIERLQTRDRACGFNRLAGGNGEYHQRVRPLVHTPEARAIMSAAARAEKMRPESRARSSAALKARWEDPETKAKLLASREGKSKEALRKDPTLMARIQAGRRKTFAAKRAARTHFDCKVHGTIPLDQCRSKVAKSGIRVYECAACINAREKVKRDAFRAAHPLEPKTTFRCKVHGEISRDQCFSILRKDGVTTYRCKVCCNAANKAAHQRRKARLADQTSTPPGDDEDDAGRTFSAALTNSAAACLASSAVM